MPGCVIDAYGDKHLEAYTKADANTFCDSLIARGLAGEALWQFYLPNLLRTLGAGCGPVAGLELEMRVAAGSIEPVRQVHLRETHAPLQVCGRGAGPQVGLHEDAGNLAHVIRRADPAHHRAILGLQLVMEVAVIRLEALLAADARGVAAKSALAGAAPLGITITSAIDLGEHPEISGLMSEVSGDPRRLATCQSEIPLQVRDQLFGNGDRSGLSLRRLSRGSRLRISVGKTRSAIGESGRGSGYKKGGRCSGKISHGASHLLQIRMPRRGGR